MKVRRGHSLCAIVPRVYFLNILLNNNIFFSFFADFRIDLLVLIFTKKGLTAICRGLRGAEFKDRACFFL